MRKQACAAYAKREIIQSILIGPLSLAFGIFIATLAISTSALDFFVLHFAENFFYIFVIFFLCNFIFNIFGHIPPALWIEETIQFGGHGYLSVYPR